MGAGSLGQDMAGSGTGNPPVRRPIHRLRYLNVIEPNVRIDLKSLRRKLNLNQGRFHPQAGPHAYVEPSAPPAKGGRELFTDLSSAAEPFSTIFLGAAHAGAIALPRRLSDRPSPPAPWWS